MAERRRHSRQGLVLEVTVAFSTVDELVGARTLDVSRSGLFLATTSLRPIGTRVRLRLSIGRPPQQFEVDGVVQRVQTPETSATPGLGIELLTPPPEWLQFADTLAAGAGSDGDGTRRTPAVSRFQEISALPLVRERRDEPLFRALLAAPERALASAEVLIEFGAVNESMFIVLDGSLEVRLEGGAAVAVLSAGRTVGELSVLDGRTASATVVAQRPTRVLVIDHDEFWRLVRVSHGFALHLLLELAGRVRADNGRLTEVDSARRRSESEATIDVLTGLRNRRWLDAHLPIFVTSAIKDDRPLSVISVDIDHFKRFNDTYGHAAGDSVLQAVARALADGVRQGEHVVRVGGEELLVLCPAVAPEGARRLAERLRAGVRACVVSGPTGAMLPQVTASFGVATRHPQESQDDLLHRADTQLYAAKEGGRDRVVTDVEATAATA